MCMQWLGGMQATSRRERDLAVDALAVALAVSATLEAFVRAPFDTTARLSIRDDQAEMSCGVLCRVASRAVQRQTCRRRSGGEQHAETTHKNDPLLAVSLGRNNFEAKSRNQLERPTQEANSRRGAS